MGLINLRLRVTGMMAGQAYRLTSGARLVWSVTSDSGEEDIGKKKEGKTNSKQSRKSG